MIGYRMAQILRQESIFQWSEINFKLFGYFLTYDSSPPNKFMVRISAFNESVYNQQCKVYLKKARLLVKNMVIGHYDNVPV